MPSYSGACFTNSFLSAIQIWWKLRLAIILLLPIRWQQIFAHATIAQLSCHVQNFVAIAVLESRWDWNKFPSNFNWDGKNVSEPGPWFSFNLPLSLRSATGLLASPQWQWWGCPRAWSWLTLFYGMNRDTGYAKHGKLEATLTICFILHVLIVQIIFTIQLHFDMTFQWKLLCISQVSLVLL